MNKNQNPDTNDEAMAIDSITQALKPLEDIRKIAVLNFILGRFSKTPKEDVLFVTGGTNAGDVKEFLEKKSPKNAYQQVAVLAYFLRQHRGIGAINKKIIKEINEEALGMTIDNIPQVLNDAKNKYKFFASSSGGKKILLAHGEKVVNALPDQGKASELMKILNKKTHSRKKHKKNKSNKKKK